MFQNVGGGAKLLKGARMALKMLEFMLYATRWLLAHLQASMDALETIKNKITCLQWKISMNIDSTDIK